MSNEKTYRSANIRTISDNAVISINLHWVRNILVGCIVLGGIIFKYEQRLRQAEERINDLTERVDDLRKIHDAEIEEIQAWYKKSLEIDLNPLNILKRKKK
jgi:CRP-like cAMP-binding protein